MTATLTPARPLSRVFAVVLGDPGGHRAEIVEALGLYGFRHAIAESPAAALKQAEANANTLLVISAADLVSEPELGANPPGRRTIVIAAEHEAEALPPTVAAVLGVDEAASLDALGETLQSVAREVAYSRRRDTMLRWLERESERDATTGLRTRHAFEEALEEMCTTAATKGDPVCAIVVDVASMRFVIETQGREAGNEHLLNAATAVSRSIRITDIAGRLSTDTFGIALPGATLDIGRRVARRILQSVEQMNTSEEAQSELSLGFGVASGSGCTAAELLEAAASQITHAHRSHAHFRPRLVNTDGPSVA